MHLYKCRSDYFTQASVLIFWSRFINTAWVIIWVNAETPGPSVYLETKFPVTLEFLRSMFIFTGEHRDFTVAWYRDVGTALIVTLLLNVVEPHTVPFLKWLFGLLMMGICKTKKVMQYDLNKLHTGFDFEPEVRYPQVRLSTVID